MRRRGFGFYEHMRVAQWAVWREKNGELVLVLERKHRNCRHKTDGTPLFNWSPCPRVITFHCCAPRAELSLSSFQHAPKTDHPRLNEKPTTSERSQPPTDQLFALLGEGLLHVQTAHRVLHVVVDVERALSPHRRLRRSASESLKRLHRESFK